MRKAAIYSACMNDPQSYDLSRLNLRNCVVARPDGRIYGGCRTLPGYGLTSGQVAELQTSLQQYCSTQEDVDRLQTSLGRALFSYSTIRFVGRVTSQEVVLYEVAWLAGIQSFQVATYDLPKLEPAITKQQSRVLEAMKEDMTQSEIAAELGISEPTVQTHVRRLREYFGCKTNHGLIALAMR